MNSEQATVAKENGADLVLDRASEDIANTILETTEGLGVDHIVDVALKPNLEINLACLSQGGVISAYATASSTDELSIPLLKAMMHGCVFRFVYIYNVPNALKQAAIADINSCLKTGNYSPKIGLNVPLQNIADAHEALESSKVIGKVLVHI